MNPNRILVASFLLIIAGCNQSQNSTTQAKPLPTTTLNTPQTVVTSSPAATPEVAIPTPTTSPTVITPTVTPKALILKSPTSKEQLISADGIGSAKVGMTLGELKRLLPGAEFTVKSPFIVDFDAIAVSQGGKDQFYILYPTLLRLADTDIIEALVTDNPNYRTAEGVGPGTPLKEAETAYGDASLSYNTQNEKREYVKFAKLNTKAIAFRVKPPEGKALAGIYSSSKSELKQTKDFQQAATINLVEVYCRENCPLPTP